MGSNPDISQKYKMSDVSRGVTNTLANQKNEIQPWPFLYLLVLKKG
jgi:hypothetical protein